MTRVPLLALLVAAALARGALALDPAEQLPDPTLEARARALSKELRCLVCQNESIDDSNADLARDLRTIVRQRLVAGDDDGAVKQYLAARYGDFVLLEPPVKAKTYALWFGPAAVLALGALGVLTLVRRRRGSLPTPPPLSADEQRRLAQLLDREASSREGSGR
jgi:cytochrome c-type biogenesis protein CcmH